MEEKAKIIEQLDKWIEECNLKSTEYFERGSILLEASWLSKRVAYMNVKTLIENQDK